jgi:hypothetical protein
MNLLKSALLSAIAACAIASCESDSPENDVSQLSENARRYLSLKLGSAANANSLEAGPARGNPINESYQRIYSNMSASGRMKEDTVTVKEDSVVYTDPWVSCAQITTTENSDGSVTTVIDYGDGCEEGIDPWKYFMHGRYEYTYKNSYTEDGATYRDSYEYDSKSVNYGGRYTYENETTEWLSNGESSYEGSSEYNSVTNEYSGEYQYTANENYSWAGITYKNEGFARTTYSNLQSVIEESDLKYTTGEDYYHNTALTPLVTRFDCRTGVYGDAEAGYDNGGVANDSYMCYYIPYTSGVELIRYKQGDEEGSFQIDYGNGECDMEITIIENGTRTKIDLTQNSPIALEK